MYDIDTDIMIFEILDNDCWANIFEYLFPDKLINCAEKCQTLLNLLNINDSYLTKKIVDYFYPLTRKDLLRSLFSNNFVFFVNDLYE